MEDIFNKLRKLLRRLFRIFGFFSSKQLEKHMEEKEPEKAGAENVQEEGEVTEEQNKPYLKKSPTSVIEDTKDTIEKDQVQEITEKPQAFKREKIIDLGVRKGKMQQSNAPVQTAIYDEREIDETKESEETVVRFESPYIETDFDYTEKIHLVLPRQKFNVGAGQNIAKYMNYKLKLNNEEQEVRARVFPEENCAELGEQSIYIKKPLNGFEVIFPKEVQNRVYRYKHVDEDFYIFVAIGESKGRMLYNVELLPKRMVWILVPSQNEWK